MNRNVKRKFNKVKRNKQILLLISFSESKHVSEIHEAEMILLSKRIFYSLEFFLLRIQLSGTNSKEKGADFE